MKIFHLIVAASLLSLLLNHLFGHFFSIFLAFSAWLYCGRLSFLIKNNFDENLEDRLMFNLLSHIIFGPFSLFIMLLAFPEEIKNHIYKVYGIESIEFRKPIILKNKIDMPF